MSLEESPRRTVEDLGSIDPHVRCRKDNHALGKSKEDSLS